jgi:hypothetical protein
MPSARWDPVEWNRRAASSESLQLPVVLTRMALISSLANAPEWLLSKKPNSRSASLTASEAPFGRLVGMTGPERGPPWRCDVRWRLGALLCLALQNGPAHSWRTMASARLSETELGLYVDAGHVIPGVAGPWMGGDAFEADRLATHEVRGTPPERSPDRVTLAYDKSQFPVLAKVMEEAKAAGAAGDARLLNALNTLARAMGQPLKVAEAASSGIADVILDLHTCERSAKIREKAAECLKLLFSSSAGRGAVLTDSALDLATVAERFDHVSQFIRDDVPVVRLHALAACSAIASAPPGDKVMTDNDMIQPLRDAVSREAALQSKTAQRSEALALDALARCANSHGTEGWRLCVDSDVQTVAVAALARGRAVAPACRILQALALESKVGRPAVLSAGATLSAAETIQALVSRASTPVANDAVANCLAMLGTLCSDDTAKRDAISSGLLQSIKTIVSGWSTDHACLLHACRLVDAVSPVASARESMVKEGFPALLLEIRDSPHAREAVVRAARDAHASVIWTP